jgi:hypothetical protein
MAHDVFISYSSKDKPVADAICASIEAVGVRCWIAPRDIAIGEDWPTAISNAIGSSRCMVLVYSASSNSSEDVGRELYLAANGGLVIIPFKIEEIKPRPGVDYYLARMHWLDAMNPPTREQIAVLVERVKSFIPVNQKSGIIPENIPLPQPAPSNSPAKKTAPINKRSRWRLLWIPIVLIVLAGLAGWFVFGQKKHPDTKPTITPTLNFTAKISGFGATLYEGPGGSYPIIGPVLADVKIIGQAYDCIWLKVLPSTNGKTGWLKASQVSFTVTCANIPAANIPAMPTLNFIAKINGFGATLFEGPGDNYREIGPVLADVKIVGKANECSWLKVVTSTNGATGWLKAERVTFGVACSDIPAADFPAP